jgi:hypothetical protein
LKAWFVAATTEAQFASASFWSQITIFVAFWRSGLVEPAAAVMAETVSAATSARAPM